jgi:predicted RNA binding protein with dsRBD fold (UPF0201 family)
MKNILIFLVSLSLVMGLSAASAGEDAPQKALELANAFSEKYGSDPVIVKAIKKQNAKGMTLDQIKVMDKKWKAYFGTANFMKALIQNECGQLLKKIQKTQPYFAEIFVMDNQGAIVAMTEKTSDYWQGDEVKFKKSFRGGKGAVHVSDVKFDDSTQAYLVQISVPVKDGGKAIGAITFGIDVDKVK